MENLTLFEQETLEILKQLEHCCDIEKFSGTRKEEVKKDKSFDLSTFDINHSSLKVLEDLDAIENYLYTRGLDFHYPRVEIEYIYLQAQIDKEAGRSIPLKIPPATIKGKSIEAIKIKIRKLIEELTPKDMIQKKKHTIDLKFPETIRWENVVLKLKEGMAEIEILYGGKHIKTAGYIELGFSANKTNHKPDQRWNLLIILSVLQKQDIKQATPDVLRTMLARNSDHTIKIDAVHQTKKRLSEALEDIFNTKENPFTDNKKYYEPRFKILPSPDMRIEKLWKQGGRLNENIDYEDTQE